MDENLFHITGQNRRAWNEIASVRSKIFPPAEFFREGGITLGEHEVKMVREIFGQIAGLRVLHLQCATGEDTLSWAVLGAAADGVDISDEQIAIAQAKAAAAGLDARFCAADIYNLPGALPAEWIGEGYDLVFTGGGAIVWLPD
ncbi:MAG: methyltransferase domain-containing protein, partial [Anaerolineaceae bacterium]|nr:methyltransferase domain-containing protein [Anaerolineaceae bacterium]